MQENIYNTITQFYENMNKYMPSYEGNPCEECNLCCKKIANLGASEMEIDYMEEYVKRNNKDWNKFLKFKEFLTKSPVEKKGETCPFFDEKLKGCSAYGGRLLSCRTFACFINEKFTNLIPEFCLIKSNVKVYNDETFAETMPFVIDFYQMIEMYKKYKQEQQ